MILADFRRSLEEERSRLVSRERSLEAERVVDSERSLCGSLDEARDLMCGSRELVLAATRLVGSLDAALASVRDLLLDEIECERSGLVAGSPFFPSSSSGWT